MQDEEVHHRKEEDALHEEPEQLDLNIESKDEDDEKIVASEPAISEAEKKITEPEAKAANQEEDDKKIVASESATSEGEKKQLEPEVKDANQEDESRGGTMMVPSTTTTTTTSPRSLTQEEAKAKETDDHDEDDSEQTLTFLSGWKAPETPPERIIPRSLVEQCSRPIQKQLTTSDVRQNRLSISNSQVRKKFQQILGEPGRKDNRFSVYGPDGKVHEIWLGEKKKKKKKKRSSFDLTTGWWTFVEEYGLKECCDFVTVWMFRHRVTQRICLAIDVTTFAFISEEVSKRISEQWRTQG